MAEKLVVFTMAIGYPFSLPDVRHFADVPHICFTDQRDLPSKGWQINHVDLLLKDDPPRSSRDYKLRPHRHLCEFERSIYVDSRVTLKNHPAHVWDSLIENDKTVFGGIYHSFRKSLAEEFDAVQAAGLDYPSTLDEQRRVYAANHQQILDGKPVWGGLMARRHNRLECIEAMELWYAHVLRYSRRDQLSLPLALSKIENSLVSLRAEDLRTSDFHEWPKLEGPRQPGYHIAVPAKYSAASKPQNSSEIGSETPASPREDRLNAFQRVKAKLFQKKMTKRTTVCFGFDDEIGLHYAQDPISERRLFVSDKKRLKLYENGIAARQNQLLSDYRIPNDLIGPGDVVVDVGANVGEIGVWAEATQGRYIAFEPDPIAFQALKANISSDELHDVALSDDEGFVEFYLSTATADSSLFRPQQFESVVKTRKAMLDTMLLGPEMPKRIRLLKVEAEGMEPEVLAGAVKTLAITDFVAVDAGPERGGENTVPQVVNFLLNQGFDVTSCFLRRGTFLFSRKTG